MRAGSTPSAVAFARTHRTPAETSCARRRMLVIRALAKIERHHHESARGQAAAVVDADVPVTPRPCPAVHVEEGGERRGRDAFRTIDARQRVPAGQSREGDVALFHLVGRGLIEPDLHI